VSGRRGLLALGDSITRGRGGFPALGVHPQSWAQWLAEALDLPYLCLAQDGATAAGVAAEQVPQIAGEYDLATLYVGANDARGTAFDADAFERDVRHAATALATSAQRLLMVTIPEDLGRPRAGADVLTANRAIRRVAAETGATVLSLDEFHGARFLLPDAVHPTALGMVEMAERAVAALGVPVRRRPYELAGVVIDRGRLARYARWWGWQLLRDWRRRAIERVRYARDRRS
jgi:lysophospholipase L1-like esterase